MCDRCGDVSIGRHPFGIAERPAEQLIGLSWEGTYAEAAAGALHPLIAEVQALARANRDPFSNSIVGISWNDLPGGFRYFVGTKRDDLLPSRPLVTEKLSLPAMRFASVWHGPEDGDVVQHYGAMLGWIGQNGRKRDISVLHHREEYPLDVDLAAAPVLRLMLPIA